MTVGPLPRHCAEVVIRSAGGLRLGWRAGWGWFRSYQRCPRVLPRWLLVAQ
jgi:hypothetical protein